MSLNLFAYCETTAGFLTVGHATLFLRITRQRLSTGHYQRRADCGHNQQNHGTNNRRLQRLSRPTWRLTRRSKSVSTCILVGFNLLWGCSNVFRSQRKTRATPAKVHRLDNLPVPSMPWRPCTDLCFF